MEAIECHHKETIESSPALPGIEIGTCVYCGQVTRYSRDGGKRIATITKLGRIDGKIIMPPAAHIKSLLSDEDKEALKSVPKQPEKPVPEAIRPSGQLPPKSDVPNPSALKSGRHHRHGEKFLREMDKVRDDVLADYYNMKIRDFLGKWHISSNTWIRLKKRWDINPKRLVAKAGGKAVSTLPKQPPLPPEASGEYIEKGYPRKVNKPVTDTTSQSDAEAKVDEIKVYDDTKPKKQFEILFDESKWDAVIKSIKTRFRELEGYLPPGFPRFRWWWRKDVQVEWLRTYAKLMLGKDS